MTDPNTGSDLVTLKTAKGDKQIPRLTPSDNLRLKNRIRKERKDEVRANIKETGVASEPACKMLNEFDSRKVDRHDVVTYGLTNEEIILPMAWLHTYGPVPESEEEYAKALARAQSEIEGWGISPADMTIAAAGAMYIDLKPKKDEKKEGEENPLAGESASPTETTSETRAA